MRPRTRHGAQRTRTRLLYVLVLVLALATTCVARESTRRSSAHLASDENPSLIDRVRAKARHALAPAGVLAILRARPAVRLRILSWIAVCVVCTWFAFRRALTAARNAITPANVLAQREAFAREIKSFRTRNAPSKGERETDEVKFAAARQKLHAVVEAKRRVDGYAKELRALETSFLPEEFHQDMFVDSGDRARDLKEAYERALVASGCKAKTAKEELVARAKWHKTHDLATAMKSWENVDASKRKVMYEGYQGGWYTANTPLGVPVYIERLGMMNAQKLLDCVSEEELYVHRLRMQGYTMKTLLPEMAKRPGVIARDKIVHVIDMKGAGMSLMGNRSVQLFKLLQEIDTNFPEFLYRTYVVNVPIGARVVWMTFSAMFPARVRAKIRVLGNTSGSNADKLAVIFGGRDRVPDFLGGWCERRLDECPPWCLKSMKETAFVPWEKNVDLTKLTTAQPASFKNSKSESALSARSLREMSPALTTSFTEARGDVKRTSSLGRLFSKKKRD